MSLNASRINVTLLIDKSGSMGSAKDTSSGKTRWEAARETTVGLAHALAQYDDDGIDLGMFNTAFKFHEGVTPDTVDNVWKEHFPTSGTRLAPALKAAIDRAQGRKKKPEDKSELIVVITDGEPEDQAEVKRTIIDAANRQTNDEDMAILFVQFGRDPGATAFLKSLDDDLQKAGAKFDIVDLTTEEEIAGSTPIQIIEKAFND